MSKKKRLRRSSPPASAGSPPLSVEAEVAPVVLNPAMVDSSRAPDRNPPGGFIGSIGQNLRGFAGASSGSAILWSRWLVLRAVGLVYVIIFAGVVQSQLALAGPEGLVPLGNYLKHIQDTNPGWLSSLLAAPSLFWISHGAVMIKMVAWTGVAAAVALVLNLWPRLMLAICWVTFLSFVSTWHVFSAAQLDALMLETALLSIPFAPAGYRPGFGANSPPSPLVTFMVRWFLFRVMIEAGMVKLMAGDPHWCDFTAMDILYETAPFPTILGYLDHQLPHAYHVAEYFLTFMAEILAPLLAVLGGRRGRWIAFVSWTVFQVGIQLTCNFGWLNTASIALGLLLLDDQMLAALLAKLRLPKLSRWLSAKSQRSAPTRAARWLGYVFSTGLWLHFSLSLFFLAKSCGVPVYSFPPALNTVINAVKPFGSVNEYSLYARFYTHRYQVEFLGSNDGGRTWRLFEYRYMPQAEDRIVPFIAPWFARFDASLELAAGDGKRARIFPIIAAHLLQQNPGVLALFRDNPFPDAPPTIIRMQGFRLKFTDYTTWRQSGRYWEKTPAGEYEPALYVGAEGRIATYSLSAGEHELAQGNIAGAVRIFEQQYREGYLAAGLRLVDIYMRGQGPWRDPDRAFALLTQLARAGEAAAENNLGLCYEYGLGTAVDFKAAERWYRTAADHGYSVALFYLGALYANDHLQPRHDVEALTFLLRAVNETTSGTPMSDFVDEHQPALVLRLKQRMTPKDIAQAEQQARRGP